MTTNAPDWPNLKCPRCGNQKDFVEFSSWEGHQDVRVDANGDPDYVGVCEGEDMEHETHALACAPCMYPVEDGHSELIYVWQAEDDAAAVDPPRCFECGCLLQEGRAHDHSEDTFPPNPNRPRADY